MCVSISGPSDLDLLTLKLVRESHQRWGTFSPNLGTLGFRVLELFAIRDGQTDRRTGGQAKAKFTAPFPMDAAYNEAY